MRLRLVCGRTIDDVGHHHFLSMIIDKRLMESFAGIRDVWSFGGYLNVSWRSETQFSTSLRRTTGLTADGREMVNLTWAAYQTTPCGSGRRFIYWWEVFGANVRSIRARSVWNIALFAKQGEIFVRYVARMGGSAHNSHCALSFFLSVDIRQWFTGKYRGFTAVLLCLGVSWMLVEVDGQIFSGVFSTK